MSVEVFPLDGRLGHFPIPSTTDDGWGIRFVRTPSVKKKKTDVCPRIEGRGGPKWPSSPLYSGTNISFKTFLFFRLERESEAAARGYTVTSIYPPSIFLWQSVCPTPTYVLHRGCVFPVFPTKKKNETQFVFQT
jgi:hypothetical protein